VIVAGDERRATVNNIFDPTDIMMAQYSIPFRVALALFAIRAIQRHSINRRSRCEDPSHVSNHSLVMAASC
jgi:hypothetical protein